MSKAIVHLFTEPMNLNNSTVQQIYPNINSFSCYISGPYTINTNNTVVSKYVSSFDTVDNIINPISKRMSPVNTNSEIFYEYIFEIYEFGFYQINIEGNNYYININEYKEYYVTANYVSNNILGFRIQTLDNNRYVKTNKLIYIPSNKSYFTRFFNNIISKETDSLGNLMFKIKKFYVNVCQNPFDITETDFILANSSYITTEELALEEGFNIAPAFYRNNKEIPFIYIGQYPCNSEFKSISSNNIAEFTYFNAKNGLQNLNNGNFHYYIFDYATYITLWVLKTFYEIVKEELNFTIQNMEDLINTYFFNSDNLSEDYTSDFYGYTYFVEGLYKYLLPNANLNTGVKYKIINNPLDFANEEDTAETISNKGIDFVNGIVSSNSSQYATTIGFKLNKSENNKLFFDMITDLPTGLNFIKNKNMILNNNNAVPFSDLNFGAISFIHTNTYQTCYSQPFNNRFLFDFNTNSARNVFMMSWSEEN